MTQRKFCAAYTVTVIDKQQGKIVWTQSFKQQATAWARMDEWAEETDRLEKRGKTGWHIILTTTESPHIAA